MTEVVLYLASGCHLCERARGVVGELQQELGFELREIDITGDPELEAVYREWLPVVEIDGERAFVFRLEESDFRRRIDRER